MFSILKKLNRLRLQLRKQHRLNKQIKSFNIGTANRKTIFFPDHIKTILVLDPLFCLGDAIFVNGLLKILADADFSVYVLSYKHSLDIYATNTRVIDLFDVESEKDLLRCKKNKYDIILDLQYNPDESWRFWAEILNQQKTTYTLTCSNLLIRSNLYSDWIDLRNTEHFNDRMKTIANRLTNLGEKVWPFLHVTPPPEYITPEDNYIYVNTVGRISHRTLSVNQIQAISEWFDRQTTYKGLFYLPKDVNICLGRNCRRIDPPSFLAACQLIRTCKGVISPDTSIVHVASAYNIPILSLYCLHDCEAYGSQMVDVWGPISTIRKILIPNKPKGIDFYKRRPVSEISIKELKQGLDWLSNVLD